MELLLAGELIVAWNIFTSFILVVLVYWTSAPGENIPSYHLPGLHTCGRCLPDPSDDIWAFLTAWKAYIDTIYTCLSEGLPLPYFFFSPLSFENTRFLLVFRQTLCLCYSLGTFHLFLHYTTIEGQMIHIYALSNSRLYEAYTKELCMILQVQYWFGIAVSLCYFI